MTSYPTIQTLPYDFLLIENDFFYRSRQKPLGRIARADAWRLICNSCIVIITMVGVWVEHVTYCPKVGAGGGSC